MQIPAGRLCDRFGARLVGAGGLARDPGRVARRSDGSRGVVRDRGSAADRLRPRRRLRRWCRLRALDAPLAARAGVLRRGLDGVGRPCARGRAAVARVACAVRDRRDRRRGRARADRRGADRRAPAGRRAGGADLRPAAACRSASCTPRRSGSRSCSATGSRRCSSGTAASRRTSQASSAGSCCSSGSSRDRSAGGSIDRPALVRAQLRRRRVRHRAARRRAPACARDRGGGGRRARGRHPVRGCVLRRTAAATGCAGSGGRNRQSGCNARHPGRDAAARAHVFACLAADGSDSWLLQGCAWQQARVIERFTALRRLANTRLGS